MDLAETEEHTQIFRLMFARETLGYPFLGPPDIPADRVTALRRAFQDTMRDPAFLDEATRSRLTINPISGDYIQLNGVELASGEAIISPTSAAGEFMCLPWSCFARIV